MADDKLLPPVGRERTTTLEAEFSARMIESKGANDREKRFLGWAREDGKRNIGAKAVLTAGIAGLLAGMTAGAGAQDGRALIQRMVTAYKNCNSYEGRANTDIIFVRAGKPLQRQSSSSLMQMKRPNRIHLEFTSNIGTRLVDSDGAKFYVYDGYYKKYLQMPTSPNLAQMLGILYVRGGILAYLDPLFFLSGTTLPKQLGNFQRKPDSSVNGHPVYVVTGRLQTQSQTVKAANGKTATIPATTTDWTWWIDKQSSLLQKLESRTLNVQRAVMVRQGKKTVPGRITGDQIMRHVIVSTKPNAPLQDNIFEFHPPVGATEMPLPAGKR